MSEVWCANSYSDAREFKCNWKIDNFSRAFKVLGKIESSPLYLPGSEGLVCYLVCTHINPGHVVTRVKVNQAAAERVVKEAELFTISLEFENKGKVVRLAGVVDVLCDDTWLNGKVGDHARDLFESSAAIVGTRHGWKFLPIQTVQYWATSYGSFKNSGGFWHTPESNKPLKIKMKLFYQGENRYCSSTSPMIIRDEAPGVELQERMKQLVCDPKYSDVILQCNDKKFECHKAILGAASSVLSGMFETNMKESNTGLVEIKDFEPEIVHAMIEYIYTNEVNNHHDLAQLLYIADKYDIKGLVRSCFRAFCARLDDGLSAVDMLIAADKLNKPEFKELAMQKILLEKSAFASDEEFLEKMKIYPELLMELFKL